MQKQSTGFLMKLGLKLIITLLAIGVFFGIIWISDKKTDNSSRIFSGMYDRELLESQLSEDHASYEHYLHGLEYSLPHFNTSDIEPQALTVRRMAFYDVGSTGVKFTLVDLNLSSEEKNVLEVRRVDIPFLITKENSEGIIIVLKQLQDESDAKFNEPQKTIKHIAIATAGFRNAEALGDELAKQINQQTHIDFKIIEQEDEGILSYMAVQNKVQNFSPETSLVWDIGGGSFQIVGISDNGEYEYWGSKIAARSLNKYLLRKYVGPPSESASKQSLEPINQQEIQEYLKITEALLHDSWSHKYHGLSNREFAQIHRHLEKPGSMIYGVGAVHNFVVMFLVNTLLNKNETSYTQADIINVLNLLIGKTDNDISEMTGVKNLEFVSNDISSLILVLATMNVLGVKQVNVINVNNTDGLIAREFYYYRNNEE